MANKTFTPFLGAIKEMQDRVNNADYSIIKDDGLDSSVRSYYEQGTASSIPEAIKADTEEYVNKGLNENAYITDNEERYKNLGDDEMAKDLRDRAIQSWYAVDNLTAYNVPVAQTISNPMYGTPMTSYVDEVKFYGEGQEIPKGATPLSQAEQIDAKNKRREEIIKTEEKFEFLSKSDRGKELLKDVYNDPNITSQGDYMKAINQAYSQYESEGLQKFVGTEIDRLDSEIAKLEEKNKKPYNFGRELSKATWGAYEGAREDKDLLRAKELLEEVKTSYQHLQEGAGFWKGLGNELFSWDTFTLGVESMLDNADIARHLNKFAEVGFDGLTETEKVVLDALIAREAMNSLPKGFLYNAGEAVGFSIPFMISYGLSKIPSQAIAKATSKATGEGIKKLGEYLSKRAAKEGASQAIKKADDIIQKGVKKATDFAQANPNLTKWGKEAGEVLTTGAMTSGIQTATSPHTYGDYAERQAQVKYEVDYDDNGNVQIVGKGVEQDNNALAKAITSAFIDNMSEKVGGLLIPDGATTFMGKEIKSLVKNNISPRQADFFKKVSAAWNNNPMREVAKAVDFGSFGQEFGEEIVAGVGNTLFVGDQTFEELFSGENMLTTALSIGAMSTAIGLIGGAINANEFRKSKRYYEESLRQLEQSIPDVATRNKIINQIATADYQGQNNLAQSIMATAREEAKKGNNREAQVLAERARNVVRFANAYNQVSVWNQALNVKLEERMKTEREHIRQNANADMDNHTVIAQYEGENYLVVGGKVAFNQDGTIDLANSSESVTIKSPDGEKQIISPEKLSLVADMSFEELDAQAQQMTWQRMEQELNTPTEETQPTQEAQPVAGQTPSSTEVETTPENTQAEQPQQPSYPTDEEGEPLFTQMPIEQTNQVINELGENADTFVSNRINEAQSRLEKAQNAKVKATKFNEMKREAEAINKEKQSAQAELDYWTQVQQARQVTVTPTEEVTNTEQSADNTEVNEIVNETSEQPNDLNDSNDTTEVESNLTNEIGEETQPSENTEQESNEANTTEETQTESLGEENTTEETRQRVTEEEQTQAAPMQLIESDQRAIRAEATRIEKGIRKMARELRKEWKGKDIYILEDMTDVFQRKFRQQIKENGLIGAIALNAKEEETAKQTLKRMLSPKFRGIFDGMNGEEIITSFSSHGFFKDSTGKVYVNMSANLNAEDLKVTLFHEAVAHKGLRELLGKDNFNRLCQAVAEAMPTEIKERLAKAYSESGSTITDALIADEYMASLAEQMAENNGELTIPQRIVGAMRNFFRNLFNLKLNEADIKYLLYASYKKLKGDEDIQTSINNSATLKRLQDVAVTQQADDAVRNRLVYHGSGAEFERFDHNYMGTGEGAQAYGWGTYVTDVEGIGRTYATTMRDNLISEKHKENAIINKLAKETLESNNGDKEEALNYLRSLLDEDWSDKKRVKAQIKIIETGKFLPESKQKAHLYNVDIPDDNGTNYIHWETNTQELADKLNDAYRTMLIKEKGVKEEDINPDFAPFGKGVSGGTIYNLFARELGGDKQASQFLNSLGFVGISYPAQSTTGGRADGARNFVIFNEDDAQIVEHTRFRLTQEEQDIISEAQANGTYLKAPNGKDTHLTPEQWARVRTKAFKEWFGDWELAAKYYPIRYANSVSDAMAQISEIFGKPLKNKKWEFTASITKNKSGKLKSEKATKQSKSDRLHALAVANIDFLFENAELHIEHEDIKGIKEIEKVHRFGSLFYDKENDEFIPVKITVFEYNDNSGNKIYSIEAVDIIKEKSAGLLEDDSKENPRSPITDFYAKLIELYDSTNSLNANSSKIVDENGEPMVVYHNTPNEFTIFDENKIGSSTDAGAFGRGFYFSPDDKYSLYGKNKMALFLNAKNPLMLDDSNAFNIKEPFYKDYNWGRKESEAFTQWVKDNGYDAVIYKSLNTEEDVVFSPTQIKSATDNVGTYDSNNPDIRFRFIGEQGAMNLDKAEEATIRLDNLNVARAMEEEGKDAKAIKLATGWERGADNKWRYEVADDYEFETPMSKIGRLRNELKEIEKRYERLDYATRGRLPRNASDEQKERMKKLRKEFKEVIKQARDKRIEMYDTENSMGGVHLKEFIGEDNKLFKAYPQLADYYISFVRKYNYIDAGYNGYYSDRTIWINPYLEESKIKSVFAHEIQHAIQHIEGFAQGGNAETANALRDKARAWSWRNALMETAKEYPELAGRKDLEQKLIEEYKNESLEEYIPSEEQRIKGFNLYVRGYDNEGYEEAYKQWSKVRDDNYSTYRNLSGEVESRNVQSRMDMTPEERRQSLASETEDVSRKDQIFIYDSLERANEDGVRFSLGKNKTTPETESVQNEHQPSVVSSVDGAKVIKELDNTIKVYDENDIKRSNTFIGDLAKALNAKRDGSNSEYATFEAVNGKVFTIRLADHNAKVSNFDKRDEERGISIVITAKDNKGVTNDGDAHVTEYFYDAIKLRRADGKPLVEILKSVKQSLYSGEYKDNTGLAVVTDVNNPISEDTPFDSEAGVNFRLSEETDNILSRIEQESSQAYEEIKDIDIDDNDVRFSLGRARRIRNGKRLRHFIDTDFASASQLKDLLSLSVFAQLNKGAKNLNNKRKKTGALFAEGLYDAMSPLRKYIEEIEKTYGKTLEESAYRLENMSQSKAQHRSAEFSEFVEKPFAKILKQVEKELGGGIWRKYYGIAKVGLERQAIKHAEYLEELRKRNGEIDKLNIEAMRTGKEITPYEKEVTRDYAGLTGLLVHMLIDLKSIDLDKANELMESPLDEVLDFAKEQGIELEKYVEECETDMGKDLVDKLWTTIRSISDAKLDNQLEAGLLSTRAYILIKHSIDINEIIKANLDAKIITEAQATLSEARGLTPKELLDKGIITPEQYELIINGEPKYKYYLPLKGTAELTAEKVVGDYDHRTPKDLSTIKSIRGHKKYVLDPFVMLMQDSYGSISNEEHNRWLRALLRTAQEYPIEGVKVSTVYLVPDYDSEGKKIRGSYHIASQAEINQGLALPFNDKLGFDDVYITNPQAKEHIVVVRDGGQIFQIQFADKHLADCINTLGGKLTKNKEVKIIKWSFDALNKVNRFVSSMLTSKNPTFIPFNLMRDYGEAVINNFITHGAKAVIPYMTAAQPTSELQLTLEWYLRWREGLVPSPAEINSKGKVKIDLDVWNLIEEFFANGGETAYNMLADYESTRTKIKDLISNKFWYKSKNAIREVFRFIEVFGQHAELVSRLSTYAINRGTIKKYSIEGVNNSIEESVWRAKEITTNFDKKGNWSRYLGAFMLFFNAGRQSNRNQYNLIKSHPYRYLAAQSALILVASMMPEISYLISSWFKDDDDDEAYNKHVDDYAKINNHLKNNNFVMLIDDEVITVPISPSYAPALAIAQVINTYRFSQESRMTPNEAWGSTMSTLVSTLWSDSFGGGLFSPMYDIVVNENYMGAPIYKEGTQYEGLPYWHRATSSTPNWLIEASRDINESAGGSDRVDKTGKWNNPASAQHLLSSVTGGYWKIATDLQRWDDITDYMEYVQSTKSKAESEGRRYTSPIKGGDIAKTIPVINRIYRGNINDYLVRDMEQTYWECKDEIQALRNGARVSTPDEAENIKMYIDELSDMMKTMDIEMDELRQTRKEDDIAVKEMSEEQRSRSPRRANPEARKIHERKEKIAILRDIYEVEQRINEVKTELYGD